MFQAEVFGEAVGAVSFEDGDALGLHGGYVDVDEQERQGAFGCDVAHWTGLVIDHLLLLLFFLHMLNVMIIPRIWLKSPIMLYTALVPLATFLLKHFRVFYCLLLEK